MTIDIKLPEQSTNPDLYKLREAAKQYLEQHLSGEVSFDAADKVFVAAMEALYSQGIVD